MRHRVHKTCKEILHEARDLFESRRHSKSSKIKSSVDDCTSVLLCVFSFFLIQPPLLLLLLLALRFTGRCVNAQFRLWRRVPRCWSWPTHTCNVSIKLVPSVSMTALHQWSMITSNTATRHEIVSRNLRDSMSRQDNVETAVYWGCRRAAGGHSSTRHNALVCWRSNPCNTKQPSGILTFVATFFESLQCFILYLLVDTWVRNSWPWNLERYETTTGWLISTYDNQKVQI